MKIEHGNGPDRRPWKATPSADTNLAELARACRAFNLRPKVGDDFQVVLVLADDFEGDPPDGCALMAVMFGTDKPDNVVELPGLARRQAE